jgi:hypothetical protein
MADSIRSASHGSDALVPTVRFPPLFPALLAILPGNPLDSARWLNAMLFGCTIAFVGFVVRCETQSTAAAVIASTLSLSLRGQVQTYVMAWSEPTALLLLFAGVVSLSRRSSGDSVPWMAAVAFALAMLTRYAMLFLPVFLLLSIVLWDQRPLRSRARLGILTALATAAPLAGWLFRNALVAHTATGRTLEWHPVSAASALSALTTLRRWVLPSDTAPRVIDLFVGAIVFGGIVLVCRRAFSNPSRFRRNLALLAMLYFLFLLVSVSVMDPGTPLDSRILSPLTLATIALVASELAALRTRVANFVIILACAIQLAYCIHWMNAARRDRIIETPARLHPASPISLTDPPHILVPPPVSS